MKQKKILLIIFLLTGMVAFASPPRYRTDSIISGKSLFQAKLDSLNTNRQIRGILAFPLMSLGNSSRNNNKSEILLSDSLLSRQIASLPSLISVPFDSRIASYINMLIHDKPDASSVLLGLANHYAPIISPLLKSYNLPEEIAFIPAAISGFNIYSSALNGNSGLWQLSFLNGKLGGLQINSYVDDRKDVFKSTKVAATFLKELFSIYKDWKIGRAHV